MALPKYNDIVNLFKKGESLEAQEKLIELMGAALNLQQENQELKDQVVELQNQLKQKDSFVFDGEVYWCEDDGKRVGPYCSICHDDEGKNIRLHRDGHGWYCNKCGHGFDDVKP